MSDEPYTDGDGDIEMRSGIPVLFYNGGYNGAPTIPLPNPSTGNDGDVLTLDNGVATWLPPSGGGGGSLWKTTVTLPSTLWTIPGCICLARRDLDYSEVQESNIGTVGSDLLGDYGSQDTDNYVIGTGTGTSFSVAFPVTTNGQRLLFSRSGYSASWLLPIDNGGDGTTLVRWQANLSWTGGSTTVDGRLLNGTSPNTDANAFCVFGNGGIGSSITIPLPSAINTTTSNPNTPTFVGTLAASRTWTLTLRRVSIL